MNFTLNKINPMWGIEPVRLPTPTKSRILVRFHEEIDTPLGLIIPERYTVHEQGSHDDNESRLGVTTDRRLINPQNVDVLTGKYAGETAFVYYGAYETAKWVDGNGIIDESMLLFLTDPARMLPGMYLCEEIWKEGAKTTSGIYTTTETDGVDGLRVRVVHSGGDIAVGDIIITTDQHQYELRYEGKKYLLVREKYVAGVNELPYKNNLLVEMIPDVNPERDKHNERLRKAKDFMDVHRMHYDPNEFELEPMPKFVSARVIHGQYSGKEVLIERGYGVAVSPGRAIISPDILVAVKDG